ncbi:DUF4232 domain-containing protein [Streptomyces montanisoli]|uniref:DUF4232 domain-containing protein n=1 Tax=Streptomyces montanisoli TaxID=2798581 RepID=A0A940M985_9ACTN|nr:DUF4232 domain-containing protein [Streptomyces montanisoli]MBP0456662.1 DUF4232 domain-containing protein [Streptomyces montanisoli]
MSAKKIAALALTVAAAGLSLTACGSGGQSSASAAGSSASAATGSPLGTSASDSGKGSSSSSGSSSNSGSSGSSKDSSGSNLSAKSGGSTSTTKCKTDDLGFSVASTPGYKDKELAITLTNKGSHTCSMHGYPGVQLVGPDGLGDRGPNAERNTESATASTVTLKPGEETGFILGYMPATNDSAKTYTRLDITPPNNTVSETVDLHSLAFAPAAATKDIRSLVVNPVGFHWGTGK